MRAPVSELQARRIHLGLTQLEMGELMAMHAQNIAKVERGARPAPARYTKLLSALEACTPAARAKLLDAWITPK